MAWNLSSNGGLVLLSTLPIAFFVSTVICRLYFHPLARYPGPFWAKLSSFPSYRHALKQDRHLWFHQLQQEYGT